MTHVEFLQGMLFFLGAIYCVSQSIAHRLGSFKIEALWTISAVGYAFLFLSVLDRSMS